MVKKSLRVVAYRDSRFAAFVNYLFRMANIPNAALIFGYDEKKISLSK